MPRIDKLPRFVLGPKVTERHLDKIIDDFYKSFLTRKDSVPYIFDLSDVEWIANEELLVITSLLQTLIDLEIEFKVLFLKQGSSQHLTKRNAKALIALWDVWKIYQIVPNQNYNKYFDLDGNVIDRLRADFRITTVRDKIYNSFGIKPFIRLDKIKDYDDKKIVELLSGVYTLEAATTKILSESNCYLPFQNQTLSSIITKELYENFLDHYTEGEFGSPVPTAFFSLILKRKLDENQYSRDFINNKLKSNWEKESIPEIKDFYTEAGKPTSFVNRSVLQFSFTNFGNGIPSTLREAFHNDQSKSKSPKSKLHEDTQILEFAFQFHSSRHPLHKKYQKDFTIPRGLFDLISIVKRFEGLIIARSEYGRIAFDFSHGKSIKDSVVYFGDDQNFYPGTLITIYVPERELSESIPSAAIKPYENLSDFSFTKGAVKRIALFDVQKELQIRKVSKRNYYNELFKSFLNKLEKNSDSLIYLDFKGWEIDSRVTSKIIFFLCTDYRVNLKNNVIAINPPGIEYLSAIKESLYNLSTIDKKYKVHPTPFIYTDGSDLSVFWLGIFSESDLEKLNQLLYEDHDLRSSDFQNPDEIIGHVNEYDKHGNLKSIINSRFLKTQLQSQANMIENEEVEKIILPCLKKEENSVYLCNGNYYQYEYLQLADVISSQNSLDYLSNILIGKVKNRIENLSDYLFVGITSSSNSLIDLLENSLELSKNNFVRLNNYFSFEKEEEYTHGITKDSKVVLICDVISTGFMVERFTKSLKAVGASLAFVGVIVNAIDENFEPEKHDYSKITRDLISVYDHTLNKVRRTEISSELRAGKLKVIRINPFTNTPVSHPVAESNYNNSVLLSNEKFLELIDEHHIKVGYFNFNNLIHPYFFDMHSILKSSVSGVRIVTEIFQELNRKVNIQEFDRVFFPKKSGIENVDTAFLRDYIFKNHSIKFFALERFSTNEGWRFPHPPQALIAASRHKKILILDDGSCSGESILQMIDEVAFFQPKSIVVLSLVGRINDHKREFFSRIKDLRGGENSIPTSILFGSNWHIPTYFLPKSPVQEEIKWLEKLLELPNVPSAIKSIVKSIRSEINPGKITEGDSKYLLRTKKGESIHKELALIRDHFGKIAEYRFYKEYFNFFDDFISYHETKDKKLRGEFPYRKVEAVCAVFLHEPYLYGKIKVVVPDFVEKIEEFAKILVIEGKIPSSELCYDWGKKDMIQLLFIAFQGDSLIKFLSRRNTEKLLSFTGKSESSLNYVLYKLLKYFPLTRDELKSKKHDVQLKRLLKEFISGSSHVDKQIRKFYNFLKTLPVRLDFDSQLQRLKEIYDRERTPEKHDGKVSFNHNISHILAVVREALDEVKEGKIVTKELHADIVNAWFQLTDFLSPILSFSLTFSDYLAPYPYFKFINDTEKDSNSLRSLVGKNEDLIFQGLESFSEARKIQLIEKNILRINSNFTLNSKFHQLIDHRYITWDSFRETLRRELDSRDLKYKWTEEEKAGQDLKVDIPSFYAKKVIIDELVTNLLNHSDRGSNEEIKFKFEKINPDERRLTISNRIVDESHQNSNGEGTKCLRLLSNSEHFGFHYNYKPEEPLFKQNLTFKIQ